MIVVLGATGMLGSMVNRVIEGSVGMSRPDFDAEDMSIKFMGMSFGDVVINCIGVIKPYCDNIARAVMVNAAFPHILPADTIQIATDCVFTGEKGSYTETDEHDAKDVYGRTKSMGEASHIKNLRCSIIGPEEKNHVSLLDWFLSAEGEVNGFTNHLWNGITTYHFAKICEGIIREGINLPRMQHIVPADVVSKAELLRIMADVYGKSIIIHDVEADEAVDRTLATNSSAMNLVLWKAAGYHSPPTIRQMIEELASL